MRGIWASKHIPLALKLRIYKTGVCSRLTYGSETWRLDPRTRKMLNGANSRLMARITNKSPREEASSATQTFDVIRWIRARRLQWVGHILRMPPDRLVSKALHHISENRADGDLLMDAPPYHSWEELRLSAQNREAWRRRVHHLRHGNGITVTMNNNLPGCKAFRHRHPNMSKTKSTPRAVAPSPVARKYISRDAHEAFFRPREKGKRKRNPIQTNRKKRNKRQPLTDKQRAAFARDHYERNHGPAASSQQIPPIPPTPPMTPWSPTILGHQNHPTDTLNMTIPITPTKLDDMFDYWEHSNLAQDNLRKFDNTKLSF